MGEDIMYYDYKKYGCLLALGNLIVVVCIGALGLLERNRYAAETAFFQRAEEVSEERSISLVEEMEQIESGQRISGYQVLQRPKPPAEAEDDFQILCRIVEAEAGGEDINGRMLVANVILNRVKSGAFPNTVAGVVFQKNKGTFQFSPVRDGRYYRVKISEETIEAVERALSGEDNSEGALYFVSRKAAAPERMQWFDSHLTRLFQYGGHEFFA